MDFSKAFNVTLNQFGISARSLAAQSGVSEVMISRFRNGHQVRTETLSRLLECFSAEQRDYFFSLVASDKITSRINMQYWVETATHEELQQTMLLIMQKCAGQTSQTSQSAA